MLVAALAALALAQAGAQAAPDRDWVLVYYMSYDNNLEGCGPVILDALEKGVAGTKLVVTVLSDDTKKDGLNRITLSKDGRTSEKLATDNSASEDVLKDYLAWVAKNHPARHYAIVFLDHGGRLDEMSADEWPGDAITKHWLSAKLVGPILRQWRQDAPGAVDLLFLQQCGRGSIENLYNFRGAADAILASQTSVGAPNTYYEPTGRWLGAREKTSGLELAKRIMADDEHFTNYVCVAGAALDELPKRLAPVVDALLAPTEPSPATGLKPCFPIQDEKNYDLLAWLESAFKENELPDKPLKEFREWLTGKLILEHVKKDPSAKRIASWTGLSLVVADSEKVRKRYADYPIYADTRLDDLWNAMFPK